MSGLQRLKVALVAMAVGAGFLLAQPAAAADLNGGYKGSYKDSPYPVYQPTWSGFYIGGHVGGGWTDVSWADISLTSESVNNDSDGFLGGGQIGYNYQTGAFVLGLEATVSGGDFSDTAVSGVNPAVTYSTDIDALFTLGVRAGIASGPMFGYIKGGWAHAWTSVSGFNAGVPDSFSADDDRDGWFIGAGFEYMMDRNWTIGLDYTYIDLGETTINGTTALAIPYTLTDSDMQIQTLVVRLNYKF